MRPCSLCSDYPSTLYSVPVVVRWPVLLTVEPHTVPYVDRPESLYVLESDLVCRTCLHESEEV